MKWDDLQIEKNITYLFNVADERSITFDCMLLQGETSLAMAGIYCSILDELWGWRGAHPSSGYQI
jgi:hypothetical protein